MNTNNSFSWESVKQSLLVGTRIRVQVTQHRPFGMFVKIPNVPFQGLVQITDFKDEGRMNPDEYPATGSEVDVVVLGFKELGNQIWLGMKPSQLESARDVWEEVSQETKTSHLGETE